MLIEWLIVGELEVFCYLIGCPDTKEGIVIDPGGDEQKILSKIEEMDLHIKYIVNSHGHPDHTSANKKIKEATGAPAVLHELDAKFFFQIENVRKLSSEIGCTPTEIEADILAHDGDILKVGNLELKLIHTPGHSPGGMCVYGDGNLFTGDTLFVGDAGRTDLPGASLNQLLNSLETKILPLPDDTIIWPGHDYGDTPTSTIANEKETNPYITDFILA